jgi:hypothetical protein
MSKAKTKTAEPQDDQVLPPWFDATKHSAGDGGIFETATGTLLAEDGEPVSQALRIQRAAAAASAKPETEAPAEPAASTEE